MKLIDMTGEKFGRLTVIRRGEDCIESDGTKAVQWVCKCDCGNPNDILVRGTSLRKGLTKSCGCLRRQQCSTIGQKGKGQHNSSCKQYNTYNLNGEYGIGYTNKGQEFYFDLEDYDLIKPYCWHIDNGYVVARSLNMDNTIVCMHRLVMGLVQNDGLRVDHIFHNTNDNRKEKLRLVTRSQNLMNSKMFKNNTSGYKGVYYNKKKKKWDAKITINQEDINLGRYANIEDAIEARRVAEEKYFKEYKYQC